MCRSRRLKCDEDKPFCKRCVLSNIECKGCGYGMIIAASPTAPHLDATADVRDLLYLAPQMPSHVRYTFVTNPENTMAEFIPSTGEQLLLYLKFLPCGLGHSSSLDSTIACLASALRDSRLPEHSRSDVQTLTRYNQALRDLQSSLNDPEESLAAETLCATQLLGIYEVCSSQCSLNELVGFRAALTFCISLVIGKWKQSTIVQSFARHCPIVSIPWTGTVFHGL